MFSQEQETNTCNALDVFELLNSHDQEILFDSLFKIQKPRALEEAEEPKPKPTKGTMMVLKLTEGMESLKKASRHCRTMKGTKSKQQLDKEV